MELLIPGLILVALMVYASTRIKKSVARAYEAQVFETPEFSIQKPDGFLIPIEDETAGRFNALSREFGKDENDGVRCVAATVRIIAAEDLADELAAFRGSVVREVGEDSTSDGIDLRGTTKSKGHEFLSFVKAIRSDVRAGVLRVDAIPEPTDAHQRKIQEMLESFRLN